MNIDTKTIGIILAIGIQSISLIWFISKLDSRVINNTHDIEEMMEDVKYIEMFEKKIDRLNWLLEEDASRK